MDLPDDIACNILYHSSACSVSTAERACRSLYSLSCSANEMWRLFVAESYGLHIRASDPRSVYHYIAHKAAKGGSDYLPCNVVFSDGGTPFPGHEPHQSVLQNHRCWCTSNGINRNIDLVVKMAQPCLVVSFVVANPGLGYSNPVRQVLAWASQSPPDLNVARAWDISVDGSEGEISCRNTSVQNSHSAVPVVIDFPEYPQCRDMVLEEPCQGTVAQFCHFKMMSSFDPSHHGDNEANIDIRGLWVKGIVLDELNSLLGTAVTNGCADPSYTRLHPLHDQDPAFVFHGADDVLFFHGADDVFF